MSTEIIPSAQKSPEALGAEIRNLTTQARSMTVYFGVEIGRRLAAAKSMVPYGTWGEWLKKETEFSQSTATRFMRVFEEYGDAQIGIFGAVAESSTLQNLSISNALRLLALPAEEREEFAEEVDAEHLSARELEKVIRERDAEKTRANIAETKAKMERETAQKQLTEATETIQKLESENNAMCQKISDLESRPVEVAVQRDEKAIKDAALEAKKKADAEWSKKVEKAKADLNQKTAQNEKLEKDIADLLEKLKKAEAAGASAEEAEALKEKVSALEKKLKTSDADMTRAKLLFSQLQEAYRKLGDAIDAISDAEAAEKVRAAVKTLLQNWLA